MDIYSYALVMADFSTELAHQDKCASTLNPEDDYSRIFLSIEQSKSALADFFNGEFYVEHLNSVFGGAGTEEKIFEDRISSLRGNLQELNLLDNIVYLPSEMMRGALGAFSRTGPNGEAAQIFLNADWATSNTVDAITGVVLEEVGHAIDYLLNKDLDSPGDEGELFSNNLRNIVVSEAEKERIMQENDQMSISYQGSRWSAEAALTTATTTSGTRVGGASEYHGNGNYITFNPITIGAPSGDVLLNINAFDVDLANGEVDSVFLSGPGITGYTYIGSLNGYNNKWTWTTLDITSVATVAGAYTVQVRPDEDQFGINPDSTDWKVSARYAGITTGSTNGYITDLELNSSGQVTSDILVDTTGSYELNYYLIGSSGNVDATFDESISLTKNVTFNNGPDTLAGWGSVADGTYKLRAVLTTGGSTIEDIDTWTIVKSGGSVTTTPDTPSVTISMDDDVLAIGDTSTITFTFNKDIQNFDLTDVTPENGTLSDLSSKVDNGDGTYSYTATFTPASSVEDETNVFIVGTDWEDLAGTAPANSATSANYTVDTVRPTVAISSGNSTIHNNQSELITFTLSEDSATFNQGDVNVTGGKLSQWKQVSASVYTAVFMPTNNSNVNGSITVASNRFTDSAGNANNDGSEADNTLLITVAPTAIIRSTSPSVQPGSLNKVMISLTEGSTTFTQSAISSNVQLRNFRKINDALYQVEYVAPRSGKVTLSVRAGSYTDLGGVASIAHSENLDRVSIDVIKQSSYGAVAPITRSRGGTTGIVVGRARALPGMRRAAGVFTTRRPQPVGRSASTGIFRR